MNEQYGQSAEGDNRWRIVLRSLAIWLLIICAEIIHGILRSILLVPIVGEFRSNQIGVFTGSVIIFVIAYFMIRWIGAKRTSELLIVGFLWLLLTVAFEVLFGRFVMGLSWERLGADYNVFNGGLPPESSPKDAAHTDSSVAAKARISITDYSKFMKVSFPLIVRSATCRITRMSGSLKFLIRKKTLLPTGVYAKCWECSR